MGYAKTNIVMYGIKIKEKVAKDIFDKYFSEGKETLVFPKDTFVFYRKQSEHDTQKGMVQMQPITPYTQHGEGGYGNPVLFSTMISEETDSRIHSLIYDEGFDHFIGIQIASRGYGYQDDIEYFIKNIPPEAIDGFNKVFKPLMKEYNLEDSPKIHILSQIW